MHSTMSYHGWKNRQTWNVALWLQNDEPLYRAAVASAQRARAHGHPPTYARFVREAGADP